MNNNNKKEEKNKNNKNKNKNDKQKTEKGGETKGEKKPRVALATTVSEALSLHKFRVAPEGRMKWFCEQYGIPYYEMPGWNDPKPSGHPCTHMFRSWAFLSVAADACNTFPGARHLTALDVYGRNWSFHFHAEGDVGITVVPVRPDTYGGDLARAASNRAVAVNVPHYAVMVDIYQFEHAWKAMEPSAIADAAWLTRSHTCYLIGHELSELLGGHVFSAPSDKGTITSIEGSWESVLYEGQRCVSFKPDAFSDPYPLHPYQDCFMRTGAVQVEGRGDRPGGWLHFHGMGNCWPYRITKCVFTTEAPRPVLPVVVPHPRYETLDRPLEFLVREKLDLSTRIWDALPVHFKKSWAMHGTEEVIVKGPHGYLSYRGFTIIDKTVVDAVRGDTFLLDTNGRTMRSALARAGDLVDQSIVGKISNRYPSLHNVILQNSVVYGLTIRNDNLALDVLASRPQEHVDRVLAFNRGGVGAMGSTFGRTALKTLLSLIGLLGGGWVVWKLLKHKGRGPLGWFYRLREALIEHGKREGPSALTEAVVERVDEHMKAWGNSSTMRTLVYSKDHFIGTAIEEVFKYFTGLAGAVGISVFEALPYLTSMRLLAETPASHLRVSWLDSIKTMGVARLAPTLMHLFTWWNYHNHGAVALPANLLVHWLYNIAAAELMANGLWPYSRNVLGDCGIWTKIKEWFHNWWSPPLERPEQTPPTYACVAREWIDHWVSGAYSYLRGIDYLRPGVRVRAFEAKTKGVVEAMQDWRAPSLKITFGGNPISIERSAELLRPDPCSCDHFSTPELCCRSCSQLGPAYFSHPLMLTSGALYQPAHNPYSVVCSLAARDYVDPLGMYQSPEIEAAALKMLEERLSAVVPIMDDILKGMELHNWATELECAWGLGGTKGANFLAAAEDVKQHGEVNKTRAQDKYNETIKAAGVERGEVVLKPRSVKNVSTQDQTDILPVSRALTKDFKGHFDGNKVFQVGRFQIRIVIAHATREEMRRYAELLGTSSEMVLIVSCDDMVLSLGRYAPEFGCAVIELDYTAYDQSQHKALWITLRTLLKKKMDWNGFEAWFNKHFLINCAPVTAKLKWMGTVVVIKALLRCMMRTGVGTTSIFGSIHNIIAIVFWLCECNVYGTRTPLKDSCERIGLIAKVIKRDRLDGTIFLRGMFIGNSWNVLPSASLKLGKVMKDPTLIVPRKCVPDGDSGRERMENTIEHRQRAACFVFAAVMKSVDVPDDYPILGAMKQLSEKLRAGMDVFHIVDPFMLEDAQHKLRAAEANRPEVVQQMIERYNCTEYDILDCERMILSVEALPVLVCHPLFERMREVDYE